MKQKKSQLITPPSLVNREEGYCTVLIIDASDLEVEHLALFCSISNKLYNIYFYNNKTPDIEWLDTVISRADIILNHKDSIAVIPKSTVYGSDTKYHTPLNYMQAYDINNRSIICQDQ